MRDWVALGLFFCLLTGMTHGVLAQRDSAVYHPLKEVEIWGSREKSFSRSSQVTRLDTALKYTPAAQSLTELLSMQAPLFVKSYSPGGLASVSFRGTGAEHTALLWNGLNIVSPLNGQFDFSLIPAFFLQEVSIQHGANGALFGSGAAGGVIHLNSKPEFSRHFLAAGQAMTGSFGNRSMGVKLQYGTERFYMATRLFGQYVLNNYTFQNTARPLLSFSQNQVQISYPLDTQKNAQQQQWGIQQEFFYRTKKNNTLGLRVWYQWNNRQIPPQMNVLISTAVQQDQALRNMLEWKREVHKRVYMLRQGLFREKMVYTDVLSSIYSVNKFTTSISEGEVRQELGSKHLFGAGFNNTYASGNATSFNNQSFSQNRFALFGMYRFSHFYRDWQLSATIRNEWTNRKLNPLAPGLGFSGTLLKGVVLKANMQKIYRVPTLNELYWIPGGNTALLPENGWGEDAGLTFSSEKKSWQGSYSITAFSNQINNWLIWLPEGSIWTPQNIRTVWSRGLEHVLQTSTRTGRWRFHLRAQFTYLLSTVEQSQLGQDASVGKQLIYTPRYQGNGSIRISYTTFYLSYMQSYTGVRFATSDNTTYLNPYSIGQCTLGWDKHFKNYLVSVYVQSDNLYNVSYQTIQNWAMPGRSFRTGISFTFKQTFNDKPTAP